MRNKIGIILLAILSIGLAWLLAWLDPAPGDADLRGWAGYVLLLVFSMLSLFLAEKLFTPSPHALQLAWIASGLRLIIGVGLVMALPVFGYADSEVTQAGYFYYDTMIRDQFSWRVAVENLSIIDAFQGIYPGDQYGGMLALSATIYRFLSPDFHRPFLILILTSVASSWGVLATWALARIFAQAVDHKAESRNSDRFPMIAAAFFAFFPEGVILGATHMREAFVIPSIAVALCGLFVILWPENVAFINWLNHKNRKRFALLIITSGLGVTFFFQPSLALAGLVSFGGLFLAFDFSQKRQINWRIILLLIVVGLFFIIAITSAWGRMAFSDGENPLEIVSQWLLFNLEQEGGAVDSNQIQSILGKVPFMWRSLALSIFGLVQPFLPAAVFSTGNLFWRIIGGVRAIGWYLFLPLLIYGIWSSFRLRVNLEALALRWTSLWIWGWNWFSALRAGGDQWDNPRYRAVFLSMQALLAAWVLTNYPKAAGLRRILIIEASLIAVFSIWYLGRYYFPWLNFDFTIALVGGLALSLTGLGLDWGFEKARSATSGAKK